MSKGKCEKRVERIAVIKGTYRIINTGGIIDETRSIVSCRGRSPQNVRGGIAEAENNANRYNY